MSRPLKPTWTNVQQASFYLQLATALLAKVQWSENAPAASLATDGSQPLALPSPSPDPNPAADEDRAVQWQRFVIGAVREGDYLTNDVIEVRGRFDSRSNWELKVNGGAPFKLGRRGFVLLKLLSAFSIYQDRLKQQGQVQVARYLSVPAIVNIILQLTADGAPLAGFWPAPIESDVHRSVHKLRTQLRNAGWPRLIESGQRGAGYRLSTPAANLVRSDDEKTWLAAVRQAMETVQEF